MGKRCILKMFLNALHKYSKQRGVGLPMAIFIITVLALLLSILVNVTSSGTSVVVNQLQSSKAFYAAESGAQLALSKIIPASGAPQACTSNFASINFPNSVALSGCRANVSCSQRVINSITYFSVKSIGVCGQGVDQGRRMIELMVK